MAPATPTGPRWPYGITLAAVVLDQWTKRWFLANYEMGDSTVVVPGFFNFTLTTNTGAAFSLFQNQPLALTLVSITVFCLMLVFRHKLFANTALEQTAFGLVAGGVVGNLLDRMRYGEVIDFIHWYVGEYSWPVFNIADSAICIGVGLYLLSGFRKKPAPASA